MSPSRRARGKLVVVSGPSGTGKTSICQALLDRDPNAVWSISATTRPLRGGETKGRSYEFLTRPEFEARRERGEFLEWAKYLSQLYGTPRAPVVEALEAGRDVIMEIDVQGGAQVAQQMPKSVRIFVLPPTMESLQARLEGRQTESEDQLRKRLAEADGEIGFARDSGAYRHFVVNDVLEETVAQIVGIIEQERENTDS
ncbi:MAG: guanylate kinase [Planctomycetota bacterium]|jgi:guanylate kinase